MSIWQVIKKTVFKKQNIFTARTNVLCVRTMELSVQVFCPSYLYTDSFCEAAFLKNLCVKDKCFFVERKMTFPRRNSRNERNVMERKDNDARMGHVAEKPNLYQIQKRLCGRRQRRIFQVSTADASLGQRRIKGDSLDDASVQLLF